MIPFPDKKYKIIYADPPWAYYLGGEKNASNHYDCMDIEAIKRLSVQSITDDDAVLCMWVTYPLLPESIEVLRSWGFEYSTVLFTWVKRNKVTRSWFWGCGNYTRANAELVILGRRGKGVSRQSKSISQIIETTISEHSEKPDEVRQKIVQLFGDLPRIELFARTRIHGWDTWGNDEKLNLKPLESYSIV